MQLVTKVKAMLATPEGWDTQPTERWSYYSYFAGQDDRLQHGRDRPRNGRGEAVKEI